MNLEKEDNNKTMSSSEAPPYEAELELGLGLSIGRPSSSDAGKLKTSVTILTAKDFPCVVSSSSSSSTPRPVSGTKRNADSVSRDGASSPPRLSNQVVGWPPIRASRMYSLVNQAKTQRSEDQDNKVIVCDKEKQPKEALNKKTITNINANGHNTNVVGIVVKEQSNLGFVKVNVDGIAIGRKVDLNAHSCYDSLAQTLEDMFFGSGLTVDLNASNVETKEQGTKTSKLLSGSSEFVFAYEDKDGDWMLVGDVPWRMFLSSVKRLRIMRTLDGTGLVPRFQERNERQRIKPI